MKCGTILDLVELQSQFLGRCVTQGLKCLLFFLLKKYAVDQNSEVLLQTGVMKTKMMPVISIANVCRNLM